MGGPKRWVDFIFEKLKSLGEGGGGGGGGWDVF